LDIDWYSARTQLLTLDYCIENTHAAMGRILPWAESETKADQGQAAAPPSALTPAMHAFFMTRFRGQMRRFNGFVSLAIYDMQQFRVKYQPEGFLCSLPVLSGAIALFDRCAPAR
jgi:hypothetical protein